MRVVRAAIAAGLLLACACTDSRSYAHATCVLVDVSGTYADQREEVVRIIQRGLLPRARPGDSLIVIRIDEKSYDKRAVEATIAFDSQPSRANAQKLALASKLDRFASPRPAQPATPTSAARCFLPPSICARLKPAERASSSSAT